jgi:uncharacterized radical SAM superfamily Fe-S cluster-containing enzyme
MLIARDGAIWMHRWCPIHGETESLYEEDAEIWRSRNGWATPTLAVTPDRADNFKGFPDGYRDGLPASHGQHTCILLLNVTENCNFKCPTCFASALEPGSAATLKPTMEEMLHTVDTMIARENGRLGVVMLSGGEPTVRPDIVELIERLADRPITRVMLNTNGRRIARDDKFLALLQRLNDRVEVYLQFDGMSDDIHRQLRAEPLQAEKQEIVRRLGSAGVVTTLVVTAQKGVNDHALGDILEFGLDAPYVCGLAVQPVFGSGRNPGIDPRDRLTPTGAIRRMAAQGRLKVTDFVPLPCSHKDCCDITYLVKDSKGDWSSLPDLVGKEELKKWIHLAANTISFETVSDTVKSMVKDGVLQRLFSEQQKSSSLKVAGDLFKLCGCVPGLSETLGLIGARKIEKELELKKLAQRTFRVTVKMFMDVHTFHEARIRQCCVHAGTFEEDPRRHSFCWRWIFDDATDFPERKLTRLEMR